MKKIIIAAVAALVGVAAQAANVTWSANSIAQSGSSTSYYAYLVDVTGVESSYATAESVANALAAGNFSGTVMGETAGVYNSSKGTTAIAYSNKALPASYEANQAVSYYAIVFDAATAAAASNYMSLKGDSAVSASVSAAGLLALNLGSQAANTWQSTGGGSAPEPTSGLLLLLGMAGLALKRKVA